MIFALIGARLREAGPIFAALAAVAGMVLIIGLLIGGLWWLRADAARDARAAERHQCELERALANQEVVEAQAAADRAAASAAARARTEWLQSLQEAQERAASLEIVLAARSERVICYPRHVAKELNR